MLSKSYMKVKSTEFKRKNTKSRNLKARINLTVNPIPNQQNRYWWGQNQKNHSNKKEKLTLFEKYSVDFVPDYGYGFPGLRVGR